MRPTAEALLVRKMKLRRRGSEPVKIASDVIRGISVPVGLAIGLVVWLGIFVALATAILKSSFHSTATGTPALNASLTANIQKSKAAPAPKAKKASRAP